jgi:hypothetical protein
LFRDAFALGAGFEEHLYSIHASFVDDAERLVLLAQRRGALIAGPPKMMAFAITALVGQFAHRRLTTDVGLSAGVTAGFVVELLLEGLRPREVRDTREVCDTREFRDTREACDTREARDTREVVGGRGMTPA